MFLNKIKQNNVAEQPDCKGFRFQELWRIIDNWAGFTSCMT